MTEKFMKFISELFEEEEECEEYLDLTVLIALKDLVISSPAIRETVWIILTAADIVNLVHHIIQLLFADSRFHYFPAFFDQIL